MLNQTGLQLVSGSYTAFGNNGSTAFGGTVNSPTNTALGDLSNRSDVLTALTTATDHLPVVADYQLVGVPEPSTATLAATLTMTLAVWAACRKARRTARA